MRDHRGEGINRRHVLTGAAASGGALLLPGHLRAQAAPKRGGTLRVATPYNPSSLDPATGRSSPEFVSLLALYDGLLEMDPKTLEVRPGLAKSYRFPDPKTMVLELEQGVTFHDGTPFDAEAVKFNLERAKTHPRSSVKSDLNAVDGVEASGKYQVTIRFSRPSASMPAMLTDRAGLMVSPKQFKDSDGNMDRAPVGTGPFKLVSWQDNNRIVLTRNENYWRHGLPYLDELHFVIINELPTALRTAIAGEVDVSLYLEITQKPIADRASNLVSTLTPTLLVHLIFLNYGRPPLNDLRVRHALNWAVNRDELSRVLSNGLMPGTSALFPDNYWACDPKTAHYYTYDPDRAKKLLAEAGYPDGIDIPMLGRSEQVGVQRQELLATQMARAGVRLHITPGAPQQTSAQFFGPEKKGAGRISPTGGRPDPGQFYSQLFAKNAFFNAGQVETPGFAELLAESEAAFDPDKRKEAFYKLQKLTIVDQALTVPFLIIVDLTVAQPKVKNLVIDGLLKPRFTEVYLQA